MRLTVTGVVVRAARSARITTPQRVTSLSSRVFRTGCSIRTQSTQAAPQEFPHTRPHSRPAEGDLLKSQKSIQEEEPSRRAFQNRLKEEKANTVVQDGALSGANVSGTSYVFDSISNLSPSILNLTDRRLYDIPDHPICITRKLIESVFSAPFYTNHTVADPVSTTADNFDALGFPADHPGRSRTDTYYVDSKHVLRTHTSAHQAAAFSHMARTKSSGYTICADVYRRDSIDRSHFPVFHQMEGARIWHLNQPENRTRLQAMKMRKERLREDIASLEGHNLIVEDAPTFDKARNPFQIEHDEEEVRLVVQHLKRNFELLIHRIFTAATAAGVGDPSTKDEPLRVRWVEAYFPFTSPSFELEVLWQGEWLELVGSGVVQQPILSKAGMSRSIGWAWGVGIERLAMVLFGIPDIRLFWSQDPRFLSQFKRGTVTKYEPFSKFPACYKDVAFWVPATSPSAASPLNIPDGGNAGVAAAAGGDATKANPAEVQASAFHENDVMEVVRDVGGTLVEDVKLTDEFVHPKSGRKSLCYRINYRSLERTLTNDEVNALHGTVTERLVGELGVELR